VACQHFVRPEGTPHSGGLGGNPPATNRRPQIRRKADSQSRNPSAGRFTSPSYCVCFPSPLVWDFLDPFGADVGPCKLLVRRIPPGLLSCGFEVIEALTGRYGCLPSAPRLKYLDQAVAGEVHCHRGKAPLVPGRAVRALAVTPPRALPSRYRTQGVLLLALARRPGASPQTPATWRPSASGCYLYCGRAPLAGILGPLRAA